MLESARISGMLAASDIGNLLYLIAILIFALLGHLAKKYQERKQSQQAKKEEWSIGDAEVFEAEAPQARPWSGTAPPAAPVPRAAPARPVSPPVAAPVAPPMPRRAPGGAPPPVRDARASKPSAPDRPLVVPQGVPQAGAGRPIGSPPEHRADAWRLMRELVETPGGVRITSKTARTRRPPPTVKARPSVGEGRAKPEESGLLQSPRLRGLISRDDFAAAGNLRRAFLMAELLGPPLALRGATNPLGPLGDAGA